MTWKDRKRMTFNSDLTINWFASHSIVVSWFERDSRLVVRANSDTPQSRNGNRTILANIVWLLPPRWNRPIRIHSRPPMLDFRLKRSPISSSMKYVNCSSFKVVEIPGRCDGYHRWSSNKVQHFNEGNKTQKSLIRRWFYIRKTLFENPDQLSP